MVNWILLENWKPYNQTLKKLAHYNALQKKASNYTQGNRAIAQIKCVIKSPKHLWDIQKWEKWFFSHLTLEWVIIRRQCTTPVAAHLMIQTCSDLCLIWQETVEQFSYHMRSCLLRYLQNSQEINHLWATANLSLPMKSSRTHRWESYMNRQNLLEIIHVKIRIRKEFSSPQWFYQ